ncbi:hypothetical protein V5O48_014541 [Marasmius crinis-equi]|uniref:F-box domain-containing protein n=1 Tax=Marasmius crinis-equi TaxID=585013 RepID=A0ABR3EX06_9AGAR
MEQEESVAPPDLPVEIIFLILEHIQEPDDIRSISLVSSIWRGAAQATIFERILVENAHECEFWCEKFTKHPQLGRYVQDLVLCDRQIDCIEPYLRSVAAKTLISSLPNVRKLELGSMMQWGPVELQLIKGLCRSLRVLSIDGVVGMDRRRALPELLCALPNVEVLTLGQIGEDFPAMDMAPLREDRMVMRKVVPDAGRRTKLYGLTLIETDTAIDLLLWLTGPAFDLCKLRTLSLLWCPCFDDVSSLEVVDDFIRTVGKDITKLTLGIPVSFASAWKLTNDPSRRTYDPNDMLAEHFINTKILHHFTALETVTITAGVMGEDEDGKDPSTISSPIFLCHAKFLLQALSHGASESLELLAIEVVFDEACPYLTSFSIPPHWIIIDDLLSGDAFPSLRRVEVTVETRAYHHGGGIPTWYEVARLIGLSLPKTIKKNKDLLSIWLRPSTEVTVFPLFSVGQANAYSTATIELVDSE